VDHEHYEIGYSEYLVLQYLLDEKSSNYICEQLLLTKDEFDKNIEQLLKLGLISYSPVRKQRKNKWNKLYLFRFCTSHWEQNKWTFLIEKVLVISCFLFSLLVVFMVISGRLDLREMIILNNPNLIGLSISLVLLQFATVIGHEFCHVIFAINRGAIVPEMGAMLYYLSPSGFSDLTQIYFFDKKSSKIICLISGLVFNFTISCLSLVLFYYTRLYLFQVLFFVNMIVIFINFGFYIKLDGYYILQILLNENYLREKSINALKKGRLEFSENGLIYLAIGICSSIYLPILLINIALSVWRLLV
jgi:hypothetical protein